MTSTLVTEAITTIESASTSAALEELRVAWLGKKGKITEELKTLGALDPEARKEKGAELNRIKATITQALEEKKSTLERSELDARLVHETIDVTLPSSPITQGRFHPITQVMEEARRIFAELGFEVATGPDIEDAEHNFDALNIPAHHPARQMHDTFYLKSPEFSAENSMEQGSGLARSPDLANEKLLRTHTSPVQIRTMRGGKPPFRFIAPGATYRCDSDLTHTPMFHQLEGFVVGKDIHMGHLKGCVSAFLKAFFELDEVPVRFRPSFFPFTEPSAEVDIGCKRSREELKIGEGNDWLEIMGCGMIHPNVLKNCGIDPNEWQGFAFGMGIERLAMLKYNIPDLRTFFENDVRWLEHYGFAS